MGALRGVVVSTDHTAFEAAMVPEVMRSYELPVYRHILSCLQGGSDMADILDAILAGENKCEFGHGPTRIKVKLLGTRMSGDVCTSVGNGITNYLGAKYEYCVVNNTWDEPDYGITGVVEGDDGLFVAQGIPPTPEQFKDAGFIVKMTEAKDLGHAGFLKLYWDRSNMDETLLHEIEGKTRSEIRPFIDGRICHVLDCRSNICKCGWTMAQQKNGNDFALAKLRMAKAMSLVMESGDSPILKAFSVANFHISRRICANQRPSSRVTYQSKRSRFQHLDSVKMHHLGLEVDLPTLFEKERYIPGYKEALMKINWNNITYSSPSAASYRCSEEVFGLYRSYAEKWEDFFLNKWDGGPIPSSFAYDVCEAFPTWFDFYDRYVLVADVLRKT